MIQGIGPVYARKLVRAFGDKVREKFTRRACEKISQPPAPFHPTPLRHSDHRRGPETITGSAFELDNSPEQVIGMDTSKSMIGPASLSVPDFDLEICNMEEGDHHGDREDDKGQKGQQISEETHGGAYSLNGNSTKNAMT